MHIWIENCPQNIAHYDYLIRAETARVEGYIFYYCIYICFAINKNLRKISTAMSFYNKAIVHAKTYYYYYIRALTHELLARCADDLGMDFISEMALAKALKGYRHWGAIQKVNKQIIK